MTDKQQAIKELRYALPMLKPYPKSPDVPQWMHEAIREGMFQTAVECISIITDNAFTEEQIRDMVDNHLDEIFRMTIPA